MVVLNDERSIEVMRKFLEEKEKSEGFEKKKMITLLSRRLGNLSETCLCWA